MELKVKHNMALFRRVFISTITGADQARVSHIVNGDATLVARMKKDGRTALTFAEMRDIIQRIYTCKRSPINKVQAFCSVKKDSGSTTVCNNIAAMMALWGFKVLVIDCDPQSDMTSLLGFKSPNNLKTLFDVIEHGVDIERAITQVYEGLDLIPADLSMVKLDAIFTRRNETTEILSKTIEPLKSKYDFIFIDTSPVLSFVNTSVLFAADVVNVVTELTHSGLKSVNILAEEIERISKTSGREIQYRVIGNRHFTISDTSSEVLNALREKYDSKVLDNTVRWCVDFQKAESWKEPVFFSYLSKSIAVQDIVDLSNEVFFLNTEEVKKTIKKVI